MVVRPALTWTWGAVVTTLADSFPLDFRRGKECARAPETVHYEQQLAV